MQESFILYVDIKKVFFYKSSILPRETTPKLRVGMLVSIKWVYLYLLNSTIYHDTKSHTNVQMYLHSHFMTSIFLNQTYVCLHLTKLWCSLLATTWCQLNCPINLSWHAVGVACFRLTTHNCQPPAGQFSQKRASPTPCLERLLDLVYPTTWPKNEEKIQTVQMVVLN